MKTTLGKWGFLVFGIVLGINTVFSLPEESGKPKLFLLNHTVDTMMVYLMVDQDSIIIAKGGLETHVDNFWHEAFLYNGTINYDSVTLNKESLKAGSDGYFRLGKHELNGTPNYLPAILGNDEAENFIIIPGENYYFIEKFNVNNQFSRLSDALYYKPQDPFDIFPEKELLNILSVNASNFLHERDIDYKPSGMAERYYSNYGYCLHMFYGTPWAVRNNAGGIGEELTIRFRIPETNLNILNGFVDGERPHLFKANSRLKTVEITALESEVPFTIRVDFEDVVYFKNIKLPSPARSVSVKVIDVYKGSRYLDLVVTAVAGSNPYMVYRKPEYRQR
ncbi:MAG: hypothetical protein LBG22_05250 [Treponema sp.]|jgi:hypothetical protein|nr:hypothetical protein [Treponema sp.]